jgi:hypothetical protein
MVSEDRCKLGIATTTGNIIILFSGAVLVSRAVIAAFGNYKQLPKK